MIKVAPITAEFSLKFQVGCSLRHDHLHGGIRHHNLDINLHMHLSSSKEETIELSTKWKIKKSAILAAPAGMALTVKTVGDVKQVSHDVIMRHFASSGRKNILEIL